MPKFEAARTLVENRLASKQRPETKRKRRPTSSWSRRSKLRATSRSCAISPSRTATATFLNSGRWPSACRCPARSAGAAKQYQFPTIPQDKIAFPSEELMNGLLDLRKQPRGAAVVLADLPKDNFYVDLADFPRRADAGRVSPVVPGLDGQGHRTRSTCCRNCRWTAA